MVNETSLFAEQYERFERDRLDLAQHLIDRQDSMGLSLLASMNISMANVLTAITSEIKAHDLIREVAKPRK